DYEINRLRQLLDAQPDDLEPLGSRLKALIDEFEMAGLAVGVSVEPGLVATDEVAAALNDAAREALRNVTKHAGVTTARIVASWSDGGIQVVVSDMGRGFTASASRMGFGLAHSIEARMVDIGGRALVESLVGTGTRVVLWGPT